MGRDINGKYRSIIQRVIAKADIPEQDREDLQQEAELALLIAKAKLEDELNPRLAAKVIKDRVNECLTHAPPAEDITKRKTIRQYDQQESYELNIDAQLDAEKAVHLVNRLPDPYKFILVHTFGLSDNPIFTEKQISYLLQKPPDWVTKKKSQALTRLREIMIK